MFKSAMRIYNNTDIINRAVNYMCYQLHKEMIPIVAYTNG
jgi:hypothetical protein